MPTTSGFWNRNARLIYLSLKVVGFSSTWPSASMTRMTCPPLALFSNVYNKQGSGASMWLKRRERNSETLMGNLTIEPDETAGLHLAHEGIVEELSWVHLFGFGVSAGKFLQHGLHRIDGRKRYFEQMFFDVDVVSLGEKL